MVRGKEMIKQSFLDSLTGVTIAKAKKMCKAAGHKSWEIDPAAQAIPFVAYPNTVLIWNDGKTVTRANAGDGLELDPS